MKNVTERYETPKAEIILLDKAYITTATNWLSISGTAPTIASTDSEHQFDYNGF